MAKKEVFGVTRKQLRSQESLHIILKLVPDLSINMKFELIQQINESLHQDITHEILSRISPYEKFNPLNI